MLEKSVVSEQDIRTILKEKYGICKIEDITSLKGGSANCYRIQASEGQFLLKEFQSKYSVDDVKTEPKITEFVRTRGIPAANFIRTITGEYVWQFRNRAFHLQEFVEGTIFPQNAAPDWLLWNSAILLGQVHRVLLNFPLMREGFGSEWFGQWDVDESKQRYSILIKAAEQLPRGEKREKILADLHYKIENLSKAACVCIDPDRLTRRNSHGDYHILQLICGVSSVRAIIDFSSACGLPVIFEIIRSYTYADSKCANAQIDVSNLKRYIILYLKNGELNRYDLEMMPYLYYLQRLISERRTCRKKLCPFRYFFRYEVEHLLARCGFRVAELFGDFDKSPLTDDSPEMIFIAEKCENIVDV